MYNMFMLLEIKKFLQLSYIRQIRKMQPNKLKFFFTQISAPIIGFASLFFVLLIAKNLIPSFFNDLNFVKICMFVLFFVTVLLGSMILWGRILVRLKILTKEEAKGYPYSKPWENKDKLS